MAVITPEEAGASLSPIFQGRKGRMLFRILERITGIDNINATHERLEHLSLSGPDFAKGILEDIDVTFQVGNAERLSTLPEGPFITVSNHIYGHIDGICLVDLIGHVRPQMKVMVNELLMWIRGLAPNFISVNPTLGIKAEASATSINGVKNALLTLRAGHPLSLFPAGAVSDLKPKEHWTIRDRDWQDAAIKLIRKARVPVVPIRFFDRNSNFYYGLGLLDYRIRFARLFHEMYNKRGTHPRVGIGETISVEEQNAISDPEEFKAFLRGKVYDMPEPLNYTDRSELWK